MNKNKLLTGIIFSILGFLIGLGPSFLFPVCAGLKDDGTPMKCHWTAQALLCIGLTILILAICIFIFKSKETRILATIGIAAQAIFALLLTNKLIGVCKTATMNCVALTKPMVNIFSIITIIISIVNIIYLLKISKDN